MYKNKFYSKKDLSEGAADAAKGQMNFFFLGRVILTRKLSSKDIS